MKKTKMIILPVVLMGMIVSGCSENGTEQSSSENYSTSESSSTFEPIDSDTIFLKRNVSGLSGETYSLTMPSDWIEETDPLSYNEDLEFMVGNKEETEFVACIVENKQDFASFDAYTQLAAETLSDLNETEIMFDDRQINGVSGKVCQFSSESSGLRLSYVYYITETDTHYVQLYGWTFTRLFETSHDQLEMIMNSFDTK